MQQGRERRLCYTSTIKDLSMAEYEELIETAKNLGSMDETDWSSRMWVTVCSLLPHLSDSRVREALLSVFEQYPEEESRRNFWHIFVEMEKFGGYHSELLNSVQRQPTHFTLRLLAKTLSAGVEAIEGVPIPSLLQNIADDPQYSEALRARAQSDLRRYVIWKRGVRQDDPVERVIGLSVELGIDLNPCLPLYEVEAFENAWKMKLPEAYRRFLLEVGNGNGYESGVLKLGELTNRPEVRAIAHHWHALEQRREEQLERLHSPFPLEVDWIWEEEEWDEEELDEEIDKCYHGILQLTSETCAAAEYLVVSGPARGSVWLFTDVGVGPAEVSSDFLAWYEVYTDSDRAI